MRVLITGGCGFLGRYVVRRLQANPEIDKLIVFDNLDPLCGGTPDIEHINIDIRDAASLECAIDKFRISHIVHLAAYGRNLTCRDFPEAAYAVNVQGTINLLDIAANRLAQIKRIVCASSNIVLSDQPTVYKETKVRVEEAVSLYAMFAGVSCCALRPSNIYGKGQSKTEYQMCAFAGLDSSFAKHGYFSISGDGTQSRDWTHAEDVARAFELALFSNYNGAALDVCTGKLASMNRVAEILNVPIRYANPRPGDAKELISNPIPAQEKLGFTADIRLEDGIWDAFPSVSSTRESHQ